MEQQKCQEVRVDHGLEMKGIKPIMGVQAKDELHAIQQPKPKDPTREELTDDQIKQIEKDRITLRRKIRLKKKMAQIHYKAMQTCNAEANEIQEEIIRLEKMIKTVDYIPPKLRKSTKGRARVIDPLEEKIKLIAKQKGGIEELSKLLANL